MGRGLGRRLGTLLLPNQEPACEATRYNMCCCGCLLLALEARSAGVNAGDCQGQSTHISRPEGRDIVDCLLGWDLGREGPEAAETAKKRVAGLHQECLLCTRHMQQRPSGTRLAS